MVLLAHMHGDCRYRAGGGALQRSGLIYRADLLTVEIPGARTLTQCLERAVLDASVWQRIGIALARFHAIGVHHADLNANNIVFDTNDVVRARLRSWPHSRGER
jgi:hypothetical protein